MAAAGQGSGKRRGKCSSPWMGTRLSHFSQPHPSSCQPLVPLRAAASLFLPLPLIQLFLRRKVQDSSVTHTRCRIQPWISTGCWKNAHSRASGGNWEISAGTIGFRVTQRQPKGLISVYLLITSLFPGPCAPYSDSEGTSEVG